MCPVGKAGNKVAAEAQRSAVSLQLLVLWSAVAGFHPQHLQLSAPPPFAGGRACGRPKLLGN